MHLVLAAFMLASTPAPAPSSSVPDAPPPKEKMICQYEGETGTLIQKRTCHTAAQWKTIHDADQRGLDIFRNKTMQGFCPPNHPGCAG